ncbi:hypothetical protein EVAR_80162_1 [Eumeta japonica]|uniref:Uncharacterized protein n=1 Tax=Eumeta variegata TaxID=151549 RepID=A0A4C1Y6H0_EUMVA|nr:hypothetical protein EVAR_80162_1 [Eumeta japonica]
MFCFLGDSGFKSSVGLHVRKSLSSTSSSGRSDQVGIHERIMSPEKVAYRQVNICVVGKGSDIKILEIKIWSRASRYLHAPGRTTDRSLTPTAGHCRRPLYDQPPSTVTSYRVSCLLGSRCS